MEIKYRDAQKRDCSKIAEYINYASDGVLDYLFKDTVPGMTVTQILTYNLESEKGYDSYKSVIVAEDNLDIIGMIQYYSSVYHRIDEEIIDAKVLVQGSYPLLKKKANPLTLIP